MRTSRGSDPVTAYADGAIGDGRGPTGVGAVLLNGRGKVLRLGNRRLPPMTNNEAEYAGLLLALELAVGLRVRRLLICLDSEVVVGQMNGTCSVRSPTLQPWHRKACHLTRRLAEVSFTHIPRERNAFADALANEALQGRLVCGP